MTDKVIQSTGSADSVLNFYGVELQSHAALAVGAFIGILGVLQLSNPGTTRPQNFHLALSIVLALLISLVVYSGLRLVIYGSFANAI